MSNTAGPNRQPLATGGVDWLEFTVYGTLSKQHDEAVAKIENAKAKYRETRRYSDALVEFDEEIAKVELHGIGKGTNHLAICLRQPGVTIGLTDGKRFRGRVATVAIEGTRLLLDGHETVVAEANEFLRMLGVETLETRVSRLDICLDQPGVDTAQPVRHFRREQYVSRARTWSMHGRGRKSTGFTMGKSTTRLRIYDKVEELQQQAGTAKHQLMIDKRWGGELPEHATRVEFQVRREALRETLGMTTVEEVFDGLATIADYCTNDWFRLTERVDKENGNQKRAKTCQYWRHVQDGFKRWINQPSAPRVKPTKRPPEPTRLARQMAGCAISLVASTTTRVADYGEFLGAVLEEVERATHDTWRESLADKRAQRHAYVTQRHEEIIPEAYGLAPGDTKQEAGSAA